MAQRVKRLLTVWETWVRSLGQADPLEKEMATHSSTLSWKIPWTEEHSRLHECVHIDPRAQTDRSGFPVVCALKSKWKFRFSACVRPLSPTPRERRAGFPLSDSFCSSPP